MSQKELDPVSADHNQRDRIKKEIQSQLKFPVEWGSLMEGENKPAPCIEDEIARKREQYYQLKDELAHEKLGETEVQKMNLHPHSLDDKYVSPSETKKKRWKKITENYARRRSLNPYTEEPGLRGSPTLHLGKITFSPSSVAVLLQRE
eukprot:gb/GECG01013510.1/.p1 GENE.gb/GECG01013510.1/~~gb/GECG01013510.1/.p1  ORF type:complete len:148 (+),score=21.11 gb/GECG01013510.1/:1-444(+)